MGDKKKSNILKETLFYKPAIGEIVKEAKRAIIHSLHFLAFIFLAIICL